MVIYRLLFKLTVIAPSDQSASKSPIGQFLKAPINVSSFVKNQTGGFRDTARIIIKPANTIWCGVAVLGPQINEGLKKGI